MKRKFSFIILIFVLFLTACSNGNNSGNGENEYFIEFTTDSLNVYSYQIENLPINTNAEISSISFVSSDESIAKVNDLKINPYTAGTVTITATLSNGKSDSLVVNVEEDGNVPFLEVDRENLSLFEGAEFTPNYNVKLRGVNLDATYSFESSDTKVANVDQTGKITAIKAGNVDITVVATYEGYSGSEMYSLCRTINVEVKPTIILTIYSDTDNISSRSDVLNNVAFSNEANLTGTLLLNGEYTDIFDGSVEWISTNSSVAKVIGDKVVGSSVGKTEIYAQKTIDGVVYTSNHLEINVTKPTVEVNNSPVDIDLYVNEVNLSTDYMLNNDSIILAIYDQENPNINIYENGKLIDYDKLGVRKWIVESTNNNYIINVVACSKIITTKDELASLHTYGKDVVKGSSGIVSFDGYFILGNDINMSGTRFRTFCGTGTGATSVIYNGFMGVLDGRGHTVSNASVAAGNGGLFGTMNKSAIVKNIAFVNVTMSGDSGLISSNFGGTIDNVYVSGKLTCTRATAGSPSSLLVSKIYDGAKISNCVIQITNPTTNNDYSSAIGMLVTAKEDALNNVYVLGTDFKVLSTTAGDKYNILTNSNNGQFVNYSDLLKQDLTSFNNYWIFGETEINFSTNR